MLTLGLSENVPTRRGTCDFKVWDLQALGEYPGTREPPVFPSLHGVEVMLMLETANYNDELAEILMRELSALKDAGLLCVFCDNISQLPQMVFDIDPLPTREK